MLFVLSGVAMPQSFKDPSMLMLEYGHRNLASEEIALAMAKMIINELYGAEELQKQLPLPSKG